MFQRLHQGLPEEMQHSILTFVERQWKGWNATQSKEVNGGKERVGVKERGGKRKVKGKEAKGMGKGGEKGRGKQEIEFHYFFFYKLTTGC